MVEVPNSIDKRILWRFVNKKIKKVIHHSHVLSIINILFEEILQDLKDGKEIKIHNFGTLSLQNTKPRKHYDFKRKQIMISKGYKIIKFSLALKIKKKLCKYLDLDATMKGD